VKVELFFANFPNIVSYFVFYKKNYQQETSRSTGYADTSCMRTLINR